METIKISTSQNVSIEQHVASIGERILAHMLDYIFLGGYILLIMFFSTATGVKSPSFFIIIGLPVLLYDLICELTMDGQNWGKKIMGIKVIKADGSQLNLSSCFIRWIFRIVDNLLLFGGVSTLTIILNGKGQRLGDMAANTCVIRIKKPYNLSDSIYQEIPENYQVVFYETGKLTMEDISTIKEVLSFLKINGYTGKAAKMAVQTKSMIENKLLIKSDLLPAKFLETIIKDYNALNR